MTIASTATGFTGHLVGEDLDEATRVGVTLVAGRIEQRQVEIALGVLELFEKYTPQLLADPELRELKLLSAVSNLEDAIGMIKNHTPLEAMVRPQATLDYTVMAARKGIPVYEIVYAYAIAVDYVIKHIHEESLAADLPAETQVKVQYQASRITSKYVNWVVRGVLDLHERERRQWVALNSSVVSSTVHAALRGEEISDEVFAAATNYRPERMHLGAVFWSPHKLDSGPAGFGGMANRLATALRAVEEPLLVPVGAATFWAWFPLGAGSRSRPDPAALADVVDEPWRVALGMPDRGLAGLVRTHEQAVLARRLHDGGAWPDRVISYGQQGVALAGLLRADPEGSRRWVSDVLGDLDREDATELRRTLLVFLTSGSNYVRAAERLQLHRNTVRYRVQRAEEKLPSGNSAGSLSSADLLVALQVRELTGA